MGIISPHCSIVLQRASLYTLPAYLASIYISIQDCTRIYAPVSTVECPVPRTSRFAVSRLLRFSVNSRRQPVTARPVHHRCACRGSVRLSVAGAPVCLPGAGAPVCLWIINPLAGGRSPTHSRIFGALLKLRCTWKPFSGGKWSLRAPKFTKCIGFLQAHQRSPSARRCAKRIAALLVHR